MDRFIVNLLYELGSQPVFVLIFHAAPVSQPATPCLTPTAPLAACEGQGVPGCPLGMPEGNSTHPYSLLLRGKLADA